MPPKLKVIENSTNSELAATSRTAGLRWLGRTVIAMPGGALVHSTLPHLVVRDNLDKKICVNSRTEGQLTVSYELQSHDYAAAEAESFEVVSDVLGVLCLGDSAVSEHRVCSMQKLEATPNPAGSDC